MAKKSSRRSSRRHRTRRHRKMRGGDSTPAPVGGDPMEYASRLSLAQGGQFAGFHANQHGGAASLDAGEFPGAVTAPGFLTDSNMLASARQEPLLRNMSAIGGLKDYAGQAGGKRHRKSRKSHRKGQRKSRKSQRKNQRKSRRGNRKLMYGGQMPVLQPQSVNASGMLLDSAMEAKALSGMNREWQLAGNPNAFAPGYTQAPSMSQ